MSASASEGEDPAAPCSLPTPATGRLGLRTRSPARLRRGAPAVQQRPASRSSSAAGRLTALERLIVERARGYQQRKTSAPRPGRSPHPCASAPARHRPPGAQADVPWAGSGQLGACGDPEASPLPGTRTAGSGLPLRSGQACLPRSSQASIEASERFGDRVRDWTGWRFVHTRVQPAPNTPRSTAAS